MNIFDCISVGLVKPSPTFIGKKKKKQEASDKC